MCDAAAVVDFVQGEAPLGKRRLRWCYFVRNLPLVVKYTPGAKNEFADHLSRTSFEDRYGVDLFEKAKEGFQDMDADLELTIVPAVEVNHWPFDEVLQDFLGVQDLIDKEVLMIDGMLWSKQGHRVYAETRLVVPTSRVRELVQHLHAKLGHPGWNRLWQYCECRLLVLNEKACTKKCKR